MRFFIKKNVILRSKNLVTGSYRITGSYRVTGSFRVTGSYRVELAGVDELCQIVQHLAPQLGLVPRLEQGQLSECS